MDSCCAAGDVAQAHCLLECYTWLEAAKVQNCRLCSYDCCLSNIFIGS
jgi:hypothetical protein